MGTDSGLIDTHRLINCDVISISNDLHGDGVAHRQRNHPLT